MFSYQQKISVSSQQNQQLLNHLQANRKGDDRLHFLKNYIYPKNQYKLLKQEKSWANKQSKIRLLLEDFIRIFFFFFFFFKFHSVHQIRDSILEIQKPVT